MFSTTFNQLSNGALDGPDYKLELTIIHPVDTITAIDTVIVYELPLAPEVLEEDTEICAGDTTYLSANYAEGISWIRDSVFIANANDPVLMITQAGQYQVQYTSEEGCILRSEPVSIFVNELPEIPVFDVDRNLLELRAGTQLPANIDWIGI